LVARRRKLARILLLENTLGVIRVVRIVA